MSQQCSHECVCCEDVQGTSHCIFDIIYCRRLDDSQPTGLNKTALVAIVCSTLMFLLGVGFLLFWCLLKYQAAQRRKRTSFRPFQSKTTPAIEESTSTQDDNKSNPREVQSSGEKEDLPEMSLTFVSKIEDTSHGPSRYDSQTKLKASLERLKIQKARLKGLQRPIEEEIKAEQIDAELSSSSEIKPLEGPGDRSQISELNSPSKIVFDFPSESPQFLPQLHSPQHTVRSVQIAETPTQLLNKKRFAFDLTDRESRRPRKGSHYTLTEEPGQIIQKQLPVQERRKSQVLDSEKGEMPKTEGEMRAKIPGRATSQKQMRHVFLKKKMQRARELKLSKTSEGSIQNLIRENNI